MGDGIETTRRTLKDGLRVEKTIETTPNEEATVTLDVELQREAPSLVRVVEPALESVPREEIELHADHGAEHWQIEEAATFEREFEAGETYTVVYRVGGVDADRFETLDVDPLVDLSERPLDGVVTPDDADPVRDFIDGKRESLATPDSSVGGVELSFESSDRPDGDPTDRADDSSGSIVDDSATTDQREDETVTSESEKREREREASTATTPARDDVSPTEPEADEESPADGSEDASSGSSTEEPPQRRQESPSGPSSTETSSDDLGASLAATPAGGVARVLLRELREGHVDDETVEALRSELEPGRSQEVRIDHLQSQVGEFAAYVEMLESVVDEYGPFEEVFEELQAETAALADTAESAQTDIEGLSTTVEEVRSDVDTVAADTDRLRDGQEGLRADHADLEARIETMEAELEAIHERLDELDAFRQRLSGAFRE